VTREDTEQAIEVARIKAGGDPQLGAAGQGQFEVSRRRRWGSDADREERSRLASLSIAALQLGPPPNERRRLNA